MSKTLIFGSTPVEIPESGASPNWAPAVDAAFEAIAGALAGVAGAFDVVPQSISLDAFNPGVPNTDIQALNFPITNVRAFQISYAIFRETDTTTAYETGTLISVYSGNNSIGQKWETSKDYVSDGKIDFNVTDTGQVQFTAIAISGANHTGRLTFSGKAILQT